MTFSEWMGQNGLTPSGDIVGGRLGEVVEFRNGGRMGYA
jgi:hypothetical protein